MDPQLPDEDGWDWENIRGIAKEEAIWILSTLGMVALTLTIGRAISLLSKWGGINIDILNGGNWQQQIDALLKARAERLQPAPRIEPLTEDEEEDDAK